MSQYPARGVNPRYYAYVPGHRRPDGIIEHEGEGEAVGIVVCAFHQIKYCPDCSVLIRLDKPPEAA